MGKKKNLVKPEVNPESNPEPKMPNRTEKIVEWAKNNWFLSILIVFGLALAFIAALVKNVDDILDFIEKHNPQKQVIEIDSVMPVGIGVITLDDLDWDNDDSIKLRGLYCELLDSEKIIGKKIYAGNDKKTIRRVVETYFSKDLSSKDLVEVTEKGETGLSIHILFNDSVDFPEKEIEVHFDEILKGDLDDNKNIDYVIPFYTSGGGNYYYSHLLFIINNESNTLALRNCRIELDNFRFSALSIKNQTASIITYNHNEGDSWYTPTLVDTVKLKYFGDKIIFAN